MSKKPGKVVGGDFAADTGSDAPKGVELAG